MPNMYFQKLVENNNLGLRFLLGCNDFFPLVNNMSFRGKIHCSLKLLTYVQLTE